MDNGILEALSLLVRAACWGLGATVGAIAGLKLGTWAFGPIRVNHEHRAPMWINIGPGEDGHPGAMRPASRRDSDGNPGRYG